MRDVYSLNRLARLLDFGCQDKPLSLIGKPFESVKPLTIEGARCLPL